MDGTSACGAGAAVLPGSTGPEAGREAGSAPDAYDEAGVDRTLIRECLEMSPAERLAAADAAAQEVEALRARMRHGSVR